MDSAIKSISTQGSPPPVQLKEKTSGTDGKDKVSSPARETSDASKSVDKSKLPEVITALERHMNRGLHIEVEKDLHMFVAKIVDKESGEVVRQIPPKELIELQKMINENIGVLVNKEA